LEFATKKENAKIYLEKTKRPTALLKLIEEQKKDPEIKVFAEQILSAKSWYHGTNPESAEKYVKEMLTVLKTKDLSEDKLMDLLNYTSGKINQDIKTKK